MKVNKAILVFGVIILLLLLAFIRKQSSSSPKTSPKTSTATAPQSTNVTVVSTFPSPLDGATITPTQQVSITFSDAILNKDEFRSQIDPKIGYTVKLSDDRKTVTIIPANPYGFAQQYTLHISPDTKFDGGKRLDGGKSFGYRTINYSGV